MSAPKEHLANKYENGGAPADTPILRDIPRGLEVLIKKAAVDPAFKDILFEKRAGAAEAIGLKLTAAEEAMLAAVPLRQLEGIIAHTRVAPKLRPAFLGYAAGAMLAALGTAITVCTVGRSKTKDEPSEIDRLYEPGIGSMRKIRLPSAGVLADRPKGYREGRAVYVGGDAAGVETRRLEDIEYRLRDLFESVEEEYNTLVQNEEAEPRGNILVKFTITADGKVESTEIISNTTGFPELGTKTIQELKIKRFAPVKEGNATAVYLIRLNLPQRPSGGTIPSTGVIGLIHLLSYAPEVNSLSEGGDLDGIAAGTGGLGIRPDIPGGERGERNGPANPTRKRISVAAPAPSSIEGAGAARPERAPCTIAAATRKQLDVITDSYKTALAENEELGGGKIVIGFTIAAGGQVEELVIVEDSLGNGRVSETVLSAMSRLEFEPIEDGAVRVIYPLLFTYVEI